MFCTNGVPYRNCATNLTYCLIYQDFSLSMTDKLAYFTDKNNSIKIQDQTGLMFIFILEVRISMAT